MSDMSQNCLTRSFWAVAALFAALHTTHAQDYSMSIEITGEHTGMVGEVDLTGHTTYQFSLNLADPADQVLTVFGNTENPTEIVAPAGYFNSLYASTALLLPGSRRKVWLSTRRCPSTAM